MSTTKTFLLSLSANTPAMGFIITIGIVFKTKVVAKDNPEPVSLSTYRPMAKVYIYVPSNETNFPMENNIIFESSSLEIDLYRCLFNMVIFKPPIL